MPARKRFSKKQRGGQNDDYDDSDYMDDSGEDYGEEIDEVVDEDEDTDEDTDEEQDGGRRRRRRRRRQRGGSSASSYVMSVLGDGKTQWNNTFNNSQTGSSTTGNGLWSADLTKNVSGPQQTDPNLGKLMGGRRRKSRHGGRRTRRGRKSRRGGQLVDIIGQAAVPATLLAMQQRLKLKKRGGRKTRRGGQLVDIIGQAAVPATLLAMQQRLKLKKRGGRKSRHTLKRIPI
jgi:hypothetical protein